MPAFPLIAASCLFVVGLGVGYGLRVFFGQSRLLVALLLFGTLTPWLVHHLEVLRVTEDTIAVETKGRDVVPLELALTGPVVVLIVAVIAVAVPHWLRLMAVTVPGVAFLSTWFVTFGLVRRAIPSGYLPLDNMATIWLWILNVGATGILLAFCFPLGSGSVGNGDANA